MAQADSGPAGSTDNVDVGLLAPPQMRPKVLEDVVGDLVALLGERRGAEWHGASTRFAILTRIREAAYSYQPEPEPEPEHGAGDAGRRSRSGRRNPSRW
jgi:hypothetical protein